MIHVALNVKQNRIGPIFVRAIFLAEIVALIFSSLSPGERVFWSMGIALLLLFKISLGFWLSLVLWLPLSAVLSTIFYAVSAIVRPPKLQSDVNHDRPAGSIGLLR